MIRHLLIALIFCFFATDVPAQIIQFERPAIPGEKQTVQLRLKLSREYTFLIPGAGKPIRKLETMDLVLLTGIKIDRVNEKGLPVALSLETQILAGTLNGRRIDPALLQNRKLNAGLETYPCTFSAADGKELSEDAVTILSALFRQQQGITYAEILGKEKKYQPGGSWQPDITPLLKLLSGRNIILKKENLKAQALFENKFKVNGTECTAVVLHLSSAGTHAYDFQTKTRIVLPVKKSAGGILQIAREGTEVVDKKIISNDFAAAGTALRIVTKEQLEVTIAQEKKKNSNPATDFFQNIFR